MVKQNRGLQLQNSVDSVGYVNGKGVVKLPSVTNSTRGNTILTDIKEAR